MKKLIKIITVFMLSLCVPFLFTSCGEPERDDGMPYVGRNGNWWIENEDTGISADKNNVNVSAKKYSSHSEARTANPGEKIDYFIEVENKGDSKTLVIINDTAPASTEYVEGAISVKDGKLSWYQIIEAGQKAVVSYKVKVNSDMSLCDGGVIKSTKATVNEDIKVSANKIYVERTFNKVDVQYIDYAIEALAASNYSDLELAKWIYGVAYSNTSLISGNMSMSALDAIDSMYGGFASDVALDMIAPTLYGGREVTDALDGVKGAPKNQVNESDLVVGDVIISVVDGEAKTYMYASKGIFSLAKGCVKVDTGAVLSALPESDYYVVLRPSAAYVNFAPADPERTPDTLNEKQRIIVETAKYYLLRGEWLQYDDTYFATSVSQLEPNESRWQVGMKSPEEYTSDTYGYINCAAFTHDVYWTVFGKKLPGGMYTTANLTANSYANDMRMYRFTRNLTDTHTEEEKQAVKNEFLSTLQPGDIMVTRRTGNGHAMLYIGDGVMIHSSGSSFGYAAGQPGGYGVERYEPTIRFHKVEEYFFSESSTNGYVFNNVVSLCIVRPLNNTSWSGYSVTENSANRIQNLQGIIAQKLSSAKPSVSVNPGDEITYTFSIKNTNSYAVTLDITDKVAEYTTYISGAQTVSENELFWTVTVPAGETVKLSYTVKVDENTPLGTKITSNDAKIGGVSFKIYSTLVKHTLTVAEQSRLVDVVNEIMSEGTSLSGIALVNEIYKRAFGVENLFSDTDLAAVMEGEEGVLSSEGIPALKDGRQPFTLNDSGKYFDMLIPSLYGGRLLHNPKAIGDRTRLPIVSNLVVGDIIIGRTLSSRNLYMYIGGDYMINLTSGIVTDTTEVGSRLERYLGYGHYFAALRPSFGME